MWCCGGGELVVVVVVVVVVMAGVGFEWGLVVGGV